MACLVMADPLMNDDTPPLTKKVWVELIGKDPEEAKAQIVQEEPRAQVEIVDQSEQLIAFWGRTRVRIYVKEGKVSSAPRAGGSMRDPTVCWESSPTPLPIKREWPELVGKDPEEAKAKILKEAPYAHVTILEDFGVQTLDYSATRVRIYVKEGKVSATPTVG